MTGSEFDIKEGTIELNGAIMKEFLKTGFCPTCGNRMVPMGRASIEATPVRRIEIDTFDSHKDMPSKDMPSYQFFLCPKCGDDLTFKITDETSQEKVDNLKDKLKEHLGASNR